MLWFEVGTTYAWYGLYLFWLRLRELFKRDTLRNDAVIPEHRVEDRPGCECTESLGTDVSMASNIASATNSPPGRTRAGIVPRSPNRATPLGQPWPPSKK
jgi:hypothetical protein